MKALILVGGKGTRLQPLTYAVPKPMVPMMNRPFLEHMITWLRRHGVGEVILTMGYLPESIRGYFHEGQDLGVRLTYVVEDQPLDTGGAIKNCEALLQEPFLVVNGDILTDLDLQGLFRLHRESGALVTVAASRVEDPTPFGMLDTAPDGRILRWVEKPHPEQVTSHHVNVGVFLLQPEALAMMPPPPFNLERQFLAPAIAHGQPVYGYRTECYWIDIGTVPKYRQAHLDVLSRRIQVPMPGRQAAPGVWVAADSQVHPRARLIPPVVLGTSCRVGEGATVGPHTVLCDGVVVEPGATASGSVVWPGAVLGAGCRLVDCVVGVGCQVAAGAQHADQALAEEPPPGEVNECK